MNRENIDKLITHKNNTIEKEREWIKHCISIISVLLGLLISLKAPSQSDNCITVCLYLSTITLFSLNILFGLVFLYDSIDVDFRIARKLSQRIADIMNNVDVSVKADRRPIFSILRVCFFASLGLSIISLILFAFFKEINSLQHYT